MSTRIASCTLFVALAVVGLVSPARFDRPPLAASLPEEAGLIQTLKAPMDLTSVASVRPVAVQVQQEMTASIPAEARLPLQQALATVLPPIPPGTLLNKVTFLSIIEAGQVIALADTDGDRLPDASQVFFTVSDPSAQFVSAIAISRETGTFYFGVHNYDGPMKARGQVAVVKDANGDYVGELVRMFSTGEGEPVGLALVHQAAGDTLLVDSYFYSGAIFDGRSNDGFSVMAYPPGPDSTPNGQNQQIIIPKRPMIRVGNTTIIPNASWGGMAVDRMGNLLLNVAIFTAPQPNRLNINGASGIWVIPDGDRDGIPGGGQQPIGVFAAVGRSEFRSLFISEIVIVPSPSDSLTVLAASNAGALQGGENAIVVYEDADGNLQSDGPPDTFTGSTATFNPFISTVFRTGLTGASTLMSFHFDYDRGLLLASFHVREIQNNVAVTTNSGLVAFTDATGDFMPDSETSVFSGGNPMGGFFRLGAVRGVPSP